MATINFDNKVALNENPNVQDINKVKDSDVNLIKQVGNQTINTLGLYTDNWNSSGTYNINDIVIDDNRLFKNITGSYTTTEPKNDTLNWEEVTIILDEQSSSQINTYSCDYINKIGQPIEFFGDVGGDENGTYNFHCIGKVVATKISTDGIWKFEIQAPITFNTGSVNYFNWGIMPSKISALLNAKVGVQVQFDSNLKLPSNYQLYTTAGGFDYLHIGYGSVFEFVNNTYLVFARYYTTTGDAGGWPLDSFTSGQQLISTIYLREV